MKKREDNILNYKRKDKIKAVRVIFQIIFIGIVIFLFLKTLIYDGKYREPDKSDWQSQKGFVALEFPGVARTQRQGYITNTQLNKYLNYLKSSDFAAVSQNDILSFYNENEKLPDKALFLMIDSSTKNTIQFAQPILDKYQYKATILSYGSLLEREENINIALEDIKSLNKTGFWEFGTNGYRLAYINVFAKDSSFSTILYPNEFMGAKNTTYFNHYLMDYVRNSHMIPLETRKEMVERISEDYNLMESSYKGYFGFMPQLYVLMNSNSPYYGSNKIVGEVNLTNIKRLFKMNFNKEGPGLNTKDRDIYDLTRIQVDPEWCINHFIMRIKQYSKEDIEFENGRESLWEKWDILKGALQVDGNNIVITSVSGDEGSIFLKGSEGYGDVKINTSLPSKVQGRQSIYLKTSDDGQSYIRIMFHDSSFSIEQKTMGSNEVTRIFEKELNTEELLRSISISVKGNYVTVISDDAVVVDSVEFDSNIAEGGIVLSSKYNEEDPGDKIYDSVFTDFYVTRESDNDGAAAEVLYDNRYSFWDKAKNKIIDSCNYVVDWFIEKF